MSARNLKFKNQIPESRLSPLPIGIGNGNPLQYSCLKNSIDREAWGATVYGVAESDMAECTHTTT